MLEDFKDPDFWLTVLWITLVIYTIKRRIQKGTCTHKDGHTWEKWTDGTARQWRTCVHCGRIQSREIIR